MNSIILALALCVGSASAAKDDSDWHKKNAPAKNCGWVAAAPEVRCGFSRGDAGAKGEDGTYASEACAETCVRPAGDSAAWHKRNAPEKNCAWVAEYPAGRCGFNREDGGVRGEDGTTASFSCPDACAAPAACAHTDQGPGNNYCVSDLNGKINPKPESAELCWDACVATYGCDVVKGVDYGATGCFCQDDCSCVGVWTENTLELITSAAATPEECAACETPAATTDQGNENLYCVSDLNGKINPTPDTAEDCWAACEATYGCQAVASDFGATGCFCQDKCDCVGEWLENKIHLITRDAAVPALPAPEDCPGCDAATTDHGEEGSFYCSSDLNAKMNGPTTAQECWDECEAKLGCEVVGIDFGATGCFCQDSCDCVGVWTENKLHLITRGAGNALPTECAEGGLPPAEACEPATATTDRGEGNLYCKSTLNGKINPKPDTPAACFEACEGKYGCGKIAGVDFGATGCYCQDDCACLGYWGENKLSLVTSDAVHPGALPEPVTFFDHGEGDNYCVSDLNGKIIPTPETALDCWTACEDKYGCDVLEGIDFGATGCFCQDKCDCVETWTENKLHLMTRTEAVPEGCATCEEPAATTDRGEGDFYCDSGLNGKINPTPDTAEDCWARCEETYGCEVVGIDFGATGCFCQDKCDCVGVWTENKLHLITRDEAVADMPKTCET